MGELEQIMLNAIRYRDERLADVEHPGLARRDRRWLLRYIERHAPLAEPAASSATADRLSRMAVGYFG